MAIQEPLEQVDLQLGDDDMYVDPNVEAPTEEPVQNEPEAEPAVEEQVTEEAEAEIEIPQKYQGKSIAEIVHMHQEAEKLVGRQGTEVGELRNIVDSFIKSKGQEAIEESEPSVDFYDNPQEAVQKAISGSDEMKQVKEMLQQHKQAEVLSQISSAYPNYEETIQDPAFGEWVKASAVRVELLQRADSYDFNAANELLSNWGERQNIVDKAKVINEADRKQQLKAASTGGKGSGEPATRKIYKRQDIIKLMMHNPDKYAAMAEELTQAYAENRVK